MATTADAEIVLKLYDLRREEVLRKARHYIAFEFQPQTFDEFRALGQARGTPENAYWRQVLSYWDMAASLVLRGAVDPALFFDTNGEGLFLLAKFRRFHDEYKQMMGVPFMGKTAALVEKFPEAREIYQRIVKSLEARGA